MIVIYNNKQKEYSMSTWKELYQKQIPSKKTLFPEGFILRAFLSSYPSKMVEHTPNDRILDLSCGYGRNIPLYQSLGLQIFATEIDKEITNLIQPMFPDVQFAIGHASSLPYENAFFDIICACNSCYYLRMGEVFDDNLKEIFRILKPGGYFVGSIFGEKHSLPGQRNADGSVSIPSTKLNFRNNVTVFEQEQRIQMATSQDELRQYLAPYVDNITIGSLLDEQEGTTRHLYYFSCIKHK